MSVSRLWLLAAALMALTGCMREAQKPTPPPEQPSEPQQLPPQPEQKQPVDLPHIIVLLEEGDFPSAEEQLKRATRDEPDNLAAKQLLAQLTTDPKHYLGEAFTLHAVAPGESLAELARAHLGHALEFVALARYNDITQPKWLQVGQVLKIPSGYRSPLAGSRKTPPAAAGAGSERTPDVSVLERDWPPPAGLDSEALGDRFHERIEALLTAHRFDEAVATVQDARQNPAANSWSPWLNPLDTRANALFWQNRGVTLMAVSSLDSRQAAYDAFGKALALIPTLEPAREHRQSLRQALVLEYHEAAIVQYRNQQLDEALVLWDKALALDPTFAPAQGYRTRAMELQRRLRNLEVENPSPRQPTTAPPKQ